MFALAYKKAGLGKRIALLLVKLLGKSSLSLGYAATLTNTLLAPFMPSNTARSAGTVFPVFINLPPTFGSLPNDPSARRIVAYLLWTAFAASCVTSPLFMTGCAPNFLAVDFIHKIAHIELTYQGWFMAALPFAAPLLIALPLIGYLIYPPELKKSPEIPKWDDMACNHAAWTTIMLLATLVAMAEGLSKTGFIKWFAEFVAAHVSGYPPGVVLVILVTVYFCSHYFFSSLTAHTSAMTPIVLTVGLSIPGMVPEKLAMSLALTTGLMGVISPYATGAALPYYNCGYITSKEFWRNGTIYGAIFLVALLVLGVAFL
jgi:di/tricarboxylate transporter